MVPLDSTCCLVSCLPLFIPKGALELVTRTAAHNHPFPLVLLEGTSCLAGVHRPTLLGKKKIQGGLTLVARVRYNVFPASEEVLIGPLIPPLFSSPPLVSSCPSLISLILISTSVPSTFLVVSLSLSSRHLFLFSLSLPLLKREGTEEQRGSRAQAGNVILQQ